MEHFYKELVSICDLRLIELNSTSSTIPYNNNSTESFNFSLDLAPGKNVGPREISEAKGQLAKCNDKDLLNALRDEFSRQLKARELERILQSNSRPPPIKSEHFYFKSSTSQRTRLYHFDGQRIARELILADGQEAQLLLTGRDDQKMCQWNLEEAKIAEELGDEISEKEFNEEWYKSNGLPYVRPVRKIRRFLSSAIKK